ncbi:MAG: hypothetical protein SGILL_009567 [Bacillariaceae sp.]
MKFSSLSVIALAATFSGSLAQMSMGKKGGGVAPCSCEENAAMIEMLVERITQLEECITSTADTCAFGGKDNLQLTATMSAQLLSDGSIDVGNENAGPVNILSGGDITVGNDNTNDVRIIPSNNVQILPDNNVAIGNAMTNNVQIIPNGSVTVGNANTDNVVITPNDNVNIGNGNTNNINLGFAGFSGGCGGQCFPPP